MSLIDESEPKETQIARQVKIIEALLRRATRQNEVGQSAYSAFQSVIELHARVAAKTRDLERTATELESVRQERERTRKGLDEALSAMGEGFALFVSGALDICNGLFQHLLPDISDRIVPGLNLQGYLDLLETSACFVSADRRLDQLDSRPGSRSLLLELSGDRWYQLSVKRTSLDNCVVLLTEITSVVRRNRIEREHLIDRQANYLQAVFETMSAGLCTFSLEGELMMHNTQFRHLLNLPFTALHKGMTLEEVLQTLTASGQIDALSLGGVEMWREKLLRRGQFRQRMRSGTDQVLELQANLLPDGGFLVELTDVTPEERATKVLESRVQERTAELTEANARLLAEYEEKARVEEELRLAKERAEAAVSSKTRFLAAASHDLLQPINAAKLLIATLKQNTTGSPHEPMVGRLKGAFTSIEQLLHALLDISRLDSADHDAVNPTSLCLGEIMLGVFEDQMPLAEERGVTLRMVPSMLHVQSDPVYLRRSVQNLVVNAIQYTERGGRVLMGCRRHGGKLVLQVWDTGIGIGEEDQDRIFEEFARAGNVPVGSGVGLGLSIVERTCRHLGHRLWMASKVGRGSVFCIEFEVEATPRSMSRPEQGHSLEAGDMPLDRIALVVENDNDVLFATSRTLQAWGASVLAARSTEEALNYVRDIGMAPDILLVDYQLDHGDTGLHTIEAVRNETGVHVPAIMITADRSKSLMRAGSRLDFALLTKPVQVSRLRPLIEWKVQARKGAEERSDAVLNPG